MAFYKVKRPWTRQPQQFVPIDWSNPINQELRFAFYAPVYRDLVSGIPYRTLATSPDTNPLSVTRLGKGFVTQNAEPEDIVATNNAGIRSIGSSYTVISIFYKDTSEGTDPGIFSNRTSFADGLWELYRNVGSNSYRFAARNGGSLSTAIFTTGSYGTGEIKLALRYEGSSNSTLFSREGATTRTTITTASGVDLAIENTGVHELSIGGLEVDSLDNHTFARQYVHLIFGRELRQSEIDAIFDSPWHLLKPRTVSIFIPAAAGGDTTLTADPSELTFAGAVANFTITMQALPATLVLAGALAAFSTDLDAQPTALALAGASADFTTAVILDAQPGTLVLSGAEAEFTPPIITRRGGRFFLEGEREPEAIKELIALVEPEIVREPAKIAAKTTIILAPTIPARKRTRIARLLAETGITLEELLAIIDL